MVLRLKNNYFTKTYIQRFLLNLFDFTLQLNGFPIKEAIRLLNEIQQKNEADFNTYVNTKKQEIINYHLENNDF